MTSPLETGENGQDTIVVYVGGEQKAGHATLKDWAVDAIVRANSAPPLNVRIGGVSIRLGPV